MGKTEIFIQEFVVGLGYLNGLWIFAGINPEAELVKALAPVADFFLLGSGRLILILPLLITLASIVGVYFIGRWLGIVAVGLAFLGGIFANSVFGLFLLIGGLLLGIVTIGTSGE